MTSKYDPETALTARSNRILSDWRTLEKRASKVFEQLDETKTAFYEMIYVQIQLQANLNELYNSGE